MALDTKYFLKIGVFPRNVDFLSHEIPSFSRNILNLLGMVLSATIVLNQISELNNN